MKLAGTRVFTGVDAYLWPLGNSCSPDGGRFCCFSSASRHFSLSAHQHLAHEQFYVFPVFFSIVVVRVWSCSLALECCLDNGLGRISILFTFTHRIDFRQIFFFLRNIIGF